ncbi:hypothetical protein [Dysosmobacter sp. HCP28S3_G4]|uniref:hypothetical protein n=1 Tax=Dysosmobacter sp. HCP28S3_G4 TaxID=3438938 RepID=UPI003F8AA098
MKTVKWSARRAAAVGVALLFAALAYLVYRQDFIPLGTGEQRVRAIVDYASADPEDTDSLRAVLHPVVEFDETIRDRRILVFSDSEIEGLLGEIQFRRGVLGGWQPLSASYAVGPVIRSASVRDRDIRVVYAVDCPPEIAHYKVQADLRNPGSLMAEGDVTGPRFFHVHETDKDYFPALWLFDARGEQLDAADYLAVDQDYPSPGIGSAEINAVYVFCFIVLGLGWLVVKYLWGEKPEKKE